VRHGARRQGLSRAPVRGRHRRLLDLERMRYEGTLSHPKPKPTKMGHPAHMSTGLRWPSRGSESTNRESSMRAVGQLTQYAIGSRGNRYASGDTRRYDRYGLDGGHRVGDK
jgi:hypothetical protein